MFRKLLKQIVEDKSLNAEKKVEFIEELSGIANQDLLDYLTSSNGHTNIESDVDLDEYVPITKELAASYGYKSAGAIHYAVNSGHIRMVDKGRKLINKYDLEKYAGSRNGTETKEEKETTDNKYPISQWGTRKEIARKLGVAVTKIDDVINRGMVTTVLKDSNPLPYNLLFAPEVHAVLNGQYPVPKADTGVFEYWLPVSEASEELNMTPLEIHRLVNKYSLDKINFGGVSYVNIEQLRDL